MHELCDVRGRNISVDSSVKVTDSRPLNVGFYANVYIVSRLIVITHQRRKKKRKKIHASVAKSSAFLLSFVRKQIIVVHLIKKDQIGKKERERKRENCLSISLIKIRDERRPIANRVTSAGR